MANPSRRQITEAYEALANLRDSAREQSGLVADAQFDTILEALPPVPKLTMADTEWDDNKHYLAEAEHPAYGTVIMLGVGPCSGDIRITRDKELGTLWQVVNPSELVPTGRKYELKEIANG